jgi:hypothetical protein
VKAKRISSIAIRDLEEALALAFWFKNDLRHFLTLAVNKAGLLSRLDWSPSSSKRSIVRDLVGRMAANQDQYLDDLLLLMSEVSQINDFSHLQYLDDGDAKVKRAKTAIAAVQAAFAVHENLIESRRAVDEHRRVARERTLRKSAEADRLSSMMESFSSVLSQSEPHRRGYMLENLLHDLFDLFDLDPKASFKVVGEQIDGAFNFEGTDYLLEAKWQAELVDTMDLDSFNGKIGRKLDNTLGLLLAINGFEPNAVTVHSGARPRMVLMNGSDLVAVLEGRVRLNDLIRRKRQHAAQSGDIYLSVNDIL